MRYGLDEWLDVGRAFYSVKLLTAREDFFGDVSFAQHGSVISTDVRFSDQRFDHDPALLKQFDTEYVLVECYRSSESRGFANQEHTFVNKTTLHVVDFSRRYTAVAIGADVSGVLIPHSILGYAPSVHPACLSVPRRSSRGRLLALSMELLAREPHADAPAESDWLCAAMVHQVRSLFRNCAASDPVPGIERGYRSLIAEHIRRNLGQHDLGSDRICRDLGISRATLYRHCEAPGGVARLIRDERLDRCMDELLIAPAERGAVRRVAARWGFVDAGNFHRAFRARFGIRPSDCLDLPRGSKTQAAQYVHPVHRWLRSTLGARSSIRSR